MEEITKDTSIKEFMEWFVANYEGHWLPSDITKTLDRLEGYRLAKKDTEEHYVLASAVDLLRDFQTLLTATKRYADWKYTK